MVCSVLFCSVLLIVVSPTTEQNPTLASSRIMLQPLLLGFVEKIDLRGFGLAELFQMM